jgi:hypothetical protein
VLSLIDVVLLGLSDNGLAILGGAGAMMWIVFLLCDLPIFDGGFGLKSGEFNSRTSSSSSILAVASCLENTCGFDAITRGEVVDGETRILKQGIVKLKDLQ